MKKILQLLVLLLVLQSCDKKEEIIPVTTVEPSFKVPETENIVMYEINIGSFSNDGKLAGITARLAEIEALGINTIWLMPIYPIGNLNSFGSPYCVKNYLEVNPQLGGIADLKELIAKAHERKIAVIIDWVANHTSWDNPWITAHPDWYTQNASGTIISPAGTTWNDVADLNFDNQAMRLEMIAAMQYWVKDIGVDGFRCDAADLVPFDFWQQAITALNSNAGRKIILLAEGAREDHFIAGFHLNFSWDWYNAVRNVFVNNAYPGTLGTTNSSEVSAVPFGKKKLRFTTNHDFSNEETPIGVFGSKEGALAASVATIFMDGTPLIYSGQEVGVSQSTTYTSGQPINWSANAEMLTEYKKLLQFYKNSDLAKKGNLTYYNNTNFIVFEKTLANNKLLVIINCKATEKVLTPPANLLGNWENVLTNQTVPLTENMTLNGFKYFILKSY